MSMTSQPQAIPRTVALDSNLKEQLKWLSQNLITASYSGFNYAPKASEDFVVPTVFNFDNHIRRARNNSTLASLSEVGDFELQSFRAKNSFSGNGPTVQKDFQSSSVGWSSSGRPALPSVEWNGEDQSDGLENNVPSSYNIKRPSVGSFLGSHGTSKSYQQAGHSNSVNSTAGLAYTDNIDRNTSSGSSSSSGQGGSNHNSSNVWNQNYYHNERRENANYNNNNHQSKNDYNGNISSSSTAVNDYSYYPMDISDSQLADLDIDALVSDARRKSSNIVNTGTVSVPLSASVPVPLTAQQLALAAAEEELMNVMNEMEAKRKKVEALKALNCTGNSTANETFGSAGNNNSIGSGGGGNGARINVDHQCSSYQVNGHLQGQGERQGDRQGQGKYQSTAGFGNDNKEGQLQHQVQLQVGLTNSWEDTSDAVAARANSVYENNSRYYNNNYNSNYGGSGGNGNGGGVQSSTDYKNNSNSDYNDNDNNDYNNGYSNNENKYNNINNNININNNNNNNYSNGSSYRDDNGWNNENIGINKNSSYNNNNNYNSSNSSTGGYSMGSALTTNNSQPYIRTEDVKDHHTEMKNVFGHNGFREGQKECVEAALTGRDVFCLMPTGGGKSVVYQLPAWCTPGLSVVFSPLISLIQDQVDALTAIGIRAVFMSSTQDEQEGRQVFSDLFRYDTSYRHSEDGSGEMEKRIKMLYITPERFAKSEALKKALNQLYSNGMLSRFVIDEAHCLSQWGHDFRPDYLALTQIRNLYPKVPIMCLTATANQTVVGDSISIMGMRDCYKHTMSFNRANLHYSVRKKESTDKVIKNIAQVVRSRQGLTGIIYCLSKNDTETVANALKIEVPSMKNQITFYHADVAADEKEKRQRNWSKGTIKVICATIAFGMGINKPDVRYVIHHSVPKSLTNFYQESGRAGRDGGIAECILYFNYKDKGKLASMIQRSRDEKNSRSRGNWQANQDNAKLGFDNLHKCVAFCLNDIDCRRVSLLKYFGESFPRTNCRNTCDNCQRVARGEVENVDYTAHALFAIRVVLHILGTSNGRAGGLTLSKMSKILSGSRDKETVKYESVVGTVRAACVANYTASKGKSYYNGGNTSITPLPSPPTSSLNRDMSERLLQHMVLEGFITEVSIENASGFNADYLESGEPDRVNSIERGKEKLLMSVRQKGWGDDILDNNVPASKKKNKEKESVEMLYLSQIGKDKNNKNTSSVDNGEEEEEEWLSTEFGKKSKLKKNNGTKEKGKVPKILSGFDTKTPPDIDSYKSQNSTDEKVNKLNSNSNTYKSSVQNGFKVPFKENNNSEHTSAASVYGIKGVTYDSTSTDGKKKIKSLMQTGTGKDVVTGSRAVLLKVKEKEKKKEKEKEKDRGKKKRLSNSSFEMNIYSDGKSVDEESDIEAIDVDADDLSPWKKESSTRIRGIGLPSSVTKRRKAVMVEPNTDSSSDDLGLSLGSKGIKIRGDGKGKKRVRNSSADEEDVGGRKEERKKDLESPCLLSHKKQAAFLAWIDTFRRQWDGYWNKLPEVSINLMKRKPPVTRTELANIDGMGESRVNISGEAILATIYAFLEVHDLLHLFPHAVVPTLAESPLWRDPMSEEAYAIRKNLTDAEKGKVQVRQVRHTDDHGGGGGGAGGGGGGVTVGGQVVLPLAHTHTSAQRAPHQQGPLSFYSIDSYGASGQLGQSESQSQFQIQGQAHGNAVGNVSVQQALPYSQLARNTYNQQQQQQQQQQHPYISASPYAQKVPSSSSFSSSSSAAAAAAVYQSMHIANRYVDESDPLEFMQ